MKLCTCNKVTPGVAQSPDMEMSWCKDCHGVRIKTHKHRFKVMDKPSRHSVWFTCRGCLWALPIRRTAIREIFVEGKPYMARHRS